jgi:hypothetical protein
MLGNSPRPGTREVRRERRRLPMLRARFLAGRRHALVQEAGGHTVAKDGAVEEPASPEQSGHLIADGRSHRLALTGRPATPSVCTLLGAAHVQGLRRPQLSTRDPLQSAPTISKGNKSFCAIDFGSGWVVLGTVSGKLPGSARVARPLQASSGNSRAWGRPAPRPEPVDDAADRAPPDPFMFDRYAQFINDVAPGPLRDESPKDRESPRSGRSLGRYGARRDR